MKLIVDSSRHLVVKDEFKIKDLTRREFQILWQMCLEPGRVFTREQLFRKIWGEEPKLMDRTVDVHIVQLRKKIDKTVIKSIKGVGYKVNLDKEQVELIENN
ncbi:MAG: winged helix-turn-helix transcriptional regulator [Saprospiraceae bacterium]|nr:winged helix-turn-helix transcriptional regulator [Saprospiraceae bacterium]